MSRIDTPTTVPQRTRAGGPATTTYVLKVGGDTCAVRVSSLHSIPEVLGFEDEMHVAFCADGEVLNACAGDSQAIADLLESRMIAPPRPRRRRERPVSSRAMFFGSPAR